MADIKVYRKFLGDNVSIADTARIRCKSLTLGDHVRIDEGVVIEVAGDVTIGACSIIGPRNVIKGMAVKIGDYAFTREDVEIGGGQCYNANSTFRCGHSFFSGENTVINLADSVVMGDEVGLGASVGIWTHGAYLPVDQGFPCSVGPVTIGSRVWLPGNCNVLPGVKIGSNVVVGMGSLVNSGIPAGCLAGGIPARILKAQCYPKPYDPAVIMELASAYGARLQFIGAPRYTAATDGVTVQIAGACFNIPDRTVTPAQELSVVAEDFRNYLRQHGIRIRTGRPYKAYTPAEVKKWIF